MNKRHTRKRRRLTKARVRTGKQIVRHRCKKGRTGTAHSKVTKPAKSVYRVSFYTITIASMTLFRIEA